MCYKIHIEKNLYMPKIKLYFSCHAVLAPYFCAMKRFKKRIVKLLKIAK